MLSTCLGEVTVHRPPSDYANHGNAAANDEHACGPRGRDDQNHEAANRRSDFTIKQEEVLGLLRQGFPNKVIARRLGTSEADVKVDARRLLHKFGVSNRTQLAIAAMNRSCLL